MKLLYLANIRLPTEKAHGLQIMQNCEAFADAGAQVTLWVARRWNTPELRGRDPFVHYGVQRNFHLRRSPCLDLLPLVPNNTGVIARVIFALQLLTFTLAALIGVLFTRCDRVYSRDPFVLLIVSPFKRGRLVYEAHSAAHSRFGRAIQRYVVRRAHVFATTRALADALIALGAQANKTHVAHDGVKRERFETISTIEDARRDFGWSNDLFIVGYVGRLQTLAMDKGVGTLIDALKSVDGAALALVGGPDDMVAVYRERWQALGVPDDHFLYAGQVSPDDVPCYLAAFDVCAMPFPFTQHFAYYASPIKLFEYMAAGRAIVASDLPGVREVVTDGGNALLVPPGDSSALTAALIRLRDDPSLRDALGANARQLVMSRYTWEARAKAILAALK